LSANALTWTTSEIETIVTAEDDLLDAGTSATLIDFGVGEVSPSLRSECRLLQMEKTSSSSVIESGQLE